LPKYEPANLNTFTNYFILNFLQSLLHLQKILVTLICVKLHTFWHYFWMPNNSCTATSFFGDSNKQGFVAPRLPDLNLCGFYVCGMLKDTVHNKPHTEDSEKKHSGCNVFSFTSRTFMCNWHVFHTCDVCVCVRMCVCWRPFPGPSFKHGE
jgi:hypothetical protein